VSILEQNYEYDLVNTQSLLKRYIDEDIRVVVKGSGSEVRSVVEGRLLANVGSDMIVQTEAGIEMIGQEAIEEVVLEELPEGLVTRPTLVWLADSQVAGEQLCQVTYTTGQIRWEADYSAVLNANETAIDFSGWVTIDNQSGTRYEDAGIKLIAGDVRRVEPPRPERPYMMEMARAAGKGGFEEKPFMEYHMYTLGRRSTINNNQVKQIEFIEPVSGAPARKVFVYERKEQWWYQQRGQQDKVQVKIEFDNKEEGGLGMPLPRGKVRVFKQDPADGTLEFVGEDRIDHTPKDEEVSLYIGNAFDITPEYTLVESREVHNRKIERHRIELRNHKDEAVTVQVEEQVGRWVENWKIEEASMEFTKPDARTARFEVTVPAGGETVLEYTTVEWEG
jgi:hypothetical protein